MPLRSAGLLLYRWRAGQVELFLVHPGGPFWKDRDAGAWSLPKGLLDAGEDALAAARREFHEETGTAIDAPDAAFIPLGEVTQKGGKRVVAWAVAADLDAEAIRSNTYAVQWPKGTWRRYPEVDRAAWFDVAAAREKILAAQAAFIDRLLVALGLPPGTG
ncbi:MAG TPA: NUDIX domain-containing protein [Promineifilum sp.]|nr:NUDIX domain-containing protein [Promineifilum sp.]